MNPLKSQLKISIGNDFGEKFDDMLTSAKDDLHRKEGVHQSINTIQNSTLKSILEAVDKDRDAGKLDLEQGTLVKAWLMKVHIALDNLRIMTEKHRLIEEGRISAYTKAIEFAQKMVDGERKQLDALVQGMSDGTIQLENGEASYSGPLESRPDGARPSATGDAALNPLADLEQRRAEARKAKEAATKAPAEVQAVAVTEGTKEGVGTGKSTRGVRRKKP